MSPIQSRRFEGCFLEREAWRNSHDGDINEDRTGLNKTFCQVGIDNKDNEDLDGKSCSELYNDE